MQYLQRTFHVQNVLLVRERHNLEPEGEETCPFHLHALLTFEREVNFHESTFDRAFGKHVNIDLRTIDKAQYRFIMTYLLKDQEPGSTGDDPDGTYGRPAFTLAWHN